MKGLITGGSRPTVEAGADMLRRGGDAVDAAVAVVEPAIRLARAGYILAAGQEYLIGLVGEAILCYTPGGAAIFAPDGRLLRAGERFRNPALADTFERLAVEGWESPYTGALAAARWRLD